MKNIRTKQTPCFRRWSRKGWAAFASLHRHVTIGVLAVTMSILLLATQHASAHDADTAAVLKTLRIDEVGISGSQSAPTRSVQSQTPLFDRKAQAAAPVQTLESALRLAPSVDIRERGGKGMQADIFIRGGSFDQTMVLLNGIDFTDARTGHQRKDAGEQEHRHRCSEGYRKDAGQQRQRNDRQQRGCKGFHPEQLRDLVYQPPHCAHQPAVGQGAPGAGKEDGKAQGARPGQQELQGQTAQLLPGKKKLCHTTATPFKKA